MRARNVAADIKVGAFVLAALLVLIVGSLWVAGSRFLGPTKASYSVLSRDSGGLERGDRVRVAGVAVGRIKNVRLRPGEEWPVAIDVAVPRNITIRSDASAKITMSGLMGASFLQIDPGSPEAKPLTEGGEFYASGGGGFDQAMSQLAEISDKTLELMDKLGVMLDDVTAEIRPILENLHGLLSEENAEDVREILATLRRTTGEAGPRMSSLLERVEGMTEKLEAGADKIPGLGEQLDSLLADLRKVMGPDGARLSGLLDSAESSLTRADETLAILGDNRGEIEATLRDLRDTLANLKALTQRLKEQPRMILAKPERDRRPGDGLTKEDR